ncbi:MAG TPA: Cys-tRNA(Pro) deacylase [Myxococcota bacterium]|nr:Cys-tRNA(Pro) deacylase [Myxococcota bacterium]
MKTNAMRALDVKGVSYSLRTYEVDEEDLSAETVARKVGMAPEATFKTLVVRGDVTGVLFAVIPGSYELDRKLVAKASGNSKADTVALKEVQPLTGYIRGGVTVFAAKKAFPVYVDETVILFDAISISAGVRGTQIILKPDDYIRACEAKVAEIARPKGG